MPFSLKPRKAFLKLVIDTERDANRIVKAGSSEMAERLLAAANKEGRLDWTVVRPLRIGIQMDMSAVTEAIRKTTEDGAVKAFDAGLLTANEAITKHGPLRGALGEQAFADLIKGVTPAMKQTIVNRILEFGSEGQSISDAMTKAGQEAFIRINRVLMNGVNNELQVSDLIPSVKKLLTGGTLKSTITDVAPAARGAYSSMAANAERVIRTELASIHTDGVREFVRDNEYVDGLEVHLSAAHEGEDECDDYDGEVVDVDEVDSLPPFHPFCLCFTTPHIRIPEMADL